MVGLHEGELRWRARKAWEQAKRHKAQSGRFSSLVIEAHGIATLEAIAADYGDYSLDRIVKRCAQGGTFMGSGLGKASERRLELQDERT